MSRVQTIESELSKLSPEEMRQVRDWLDEMLQDQGSLAPLKAELAAGISQIAERKLQPFDETMASRIKAQGRNLFTPEQ